MMTIDQYKKKVENFLQVHDVFNKYDYIDIRLEILNAILEASESQSMEMLDEQILTEEEMDFIYGGDDE
jgi:hypothetical protein